MAAHGGRAATGDRRDDLTLRGGQAMGLPIRLAVMRKMSASSQPEVFAGAVQVGTALDMTTTPRRPQAGVGGAVRAGCGCAQVLARDVQILGGRTETVAPINRWMVGIFTPASSKCVAKECRNEWMPCPCRMWRSLFGPVEQLLDGIRWQGAAAVPVGKQPLLRPILAPVGAQFRKQPRREQRITILALLP